MTRFTFVPMPAPSGLRAKMKADYFESLGIPPNEGIQPVGSVIALGFALRSNPEDQSKSTWVNSATDENATAYFVLLDGSKYPSWYYSNELEQIMFA